MIQYFREGFHIVASGFLPVADFRDTLHRAVQRCKMSTKTAPVAEVSAGYGSGLHEDYSETDMHLLKFLSDKPSRKNNRKLATIEFLILQRLLSALCEVS